jgi:hypothetical protein
MTEAESLLISEAKEVEGLDEEIALLRVKLMRALVGISLCLIYGLDAISPLLQMSPKLSPLGQVLSGLALGRGANYVHDLYTRLAKLREDGWGSV